MANDFVKEVERVRDSIYKENKEQVLAEDMYYAMAFRFLSAIREVSNPKLSEIHDNCDDLLTSGHVFKVMDGIRAAIFGSEKETTDV